MVSFVVRVKNLPGHMYNWGALWVPMDPKLPQCQSEYVLPTEEVGFYNVPDKGSLYIRADDGGWELGNFWLGMFVEEGIGMPMVDGGIYEFDYSTKALTLVPGPVDWTSIIGSLVVLGFMAAAVGTTVSALRRT